MHKVNNVIHDHLVSLYGRSLGARTAEDLVHILRRFRGASEVKRGEMLPLTQRDALLITYGDQVKEFPKAARGESHRLSGQQVRILELLVHGYHYADIANELSISEQDVRKELHASYEKLLNPLRSLAGFCETYLRGVVSGVHILPFYPYTSDDGFSVTDFFKINPALGDWPDVQQFKPEFDLMFDAVFNHMSAQGDWFRAFLKDDPEFADFFVTVDGEPDLSQVVRPRALPLLTTFNSASGPRKVWTTFSADQVDLDVRNPRVLLKLIEALLFYVSHGAKFIRLDAIAYLWKEIGTTCIHLPQTHRVIQLFRAVLDEVAPNVMLITETNVPHSDNISYFGDGHNEAQLVYNFALPPLVMHTMLTGNSAHLTRWAQSLQLPSRAVTFFNFLASHDGIGVNPARGILSAEEIQNLVDRTQAHGGFISYKHNSDGSKSPYELNVTYFDAINNPAAPEPADLQVHRFIVSQSIMLTLAGMPGIYFHSLFGSRNDRAAALSSGINRRINRQKFLRIELEKELGDTGSLRLQVFARYCQLLETRSHHASFHPCAPQEILNLGDGIFALRRTALDNSERILCFHNIRNESIQVTVERGHWSDLLSDRAIESDGSAMLTLAPYAVMWLIEKK